MSISLTRTFAYDFVQLDRPCISACLNSNALEKAIQFSTSLAKDAIWFDLTVDISVFHNSLYFFRPWQYFNCFWISETELFPQNKINLLVVHSKCEAANNTAIEESSSVKNEMILLFRLSPVVFIGNMWFSLVLVRFAFSWIFHPKIYIIRPVALHHIEGKF